MARTVRGLRPPRARAPTVCRAVRAKSTRHHDGRRTVLDRISKWCTQGTRSAGPSRWRPVVARERAARECFAIDNPLRPCSHRIGGIATSRRR